jgi:hypothetical protein
MFRKLSKFVLSAVLSLGLLSRCSSALNSALLQTNTAIRSSMQNSVTASSAVDSITGDGITVQSSADASSSDDSSTVDGITVQSTADASSSDDSRTGDSIINLEKGSFTLTNGWKQYSVPAMGSKAFFVEGSYDGKGVPDNISVEHGHNFYEKEDGASFGRAILIQLQRQTARSLVGSITSGGITSEKGEPVLFFSFDTSDSHVNHYYVCGDHEYYFIFETNFTGSEECSEVAKNIMNTFEWKE